MRTIPAGTKFTVTAGAGSASRIADQALGKVPISKPGRMNKTEAAYALHLDALRHVGQLDSWMFEEFRLRIGDRSFYKPDFVIWMPNFAIEIHEIKGHEREAAIVRWKACAEKFHRFRFKMIKRVNGEWITTRDSWL